jgi:hypothetical protein
MAVQSPSLRFLGAKDVHIASSLKYRQNLRRAFSLHGTIVRKLLAGNSFKHPPMRLPQSPQFGRANAQ